MRYAVIDGDGIITNMSVGQVPGETCILDDGTAQIGGSWDGQSFKPPPISAVPVPQSVSRFQALAALSNAGLLAEAQTAVAAAGGLTLLAWQNAQDFQRSSPMIAAIAVTLNLTSEQVDQLYIAASQITA